MAIHIIQLLYFLSAGVKTEENKDDVVNHVDTGVTNHHAGDHNDPAFSDEEGDHAHPRLHDDEDDDDIPLGELTLNKIPFMLEKYFNRHFEMLN